MKSDIKVNNPIKPPILFARVLVALACCLLPAAAFAQDNDRPAAQRIESWKIAFITERLRLTPDEAQGFWPLYNQYEAEEKRLRQQYRPSRPIGDMTDREAEQYLNGAMEMEDKLIELQRQYIRRFQSVISMRKIALLKQVEEDFKREVLKRMQELRQGNRRN